jgi:hypothetical protein
MEVLQSEQKNRNPVMIALLVIGLIGGGGVLCCAGLMGLGVHTAKNTPKVYYVQCEDSSDPEECQTCCEYFDHSGYVFGPFVNDDGKVCGCL